jgi:hypothetical protein
VLELDKAMRAMALGLHRLSSGGHDGMVLWVDAVPSAPFPDLDHRMQQAAERFMVPVLALARQHSAALRQEHRRVRWRRERRANLAWLQNRTPDGEWLVLALVNQGQPQPEVQAACPAATQLVEALAPYRAKTVFANAFYSCLRSGSTIEPHRGPTNLRWRLHIPLQGDPTFRLRCGPLTRLCGGSTGVFCGASVLPSLPRRTAAGPGCPASRF